MELKLTLLLFILSFGTLTFSQSKGKKYDAVIYTVNNNRYKGFLQNVSEEGITIDYYGRSKYIKGDSIRKIRIKHLKAVRKHFLTSSVGGMIAGFLIYEPQHRSGKLSILAMPVYVVSAAIVSGSLGALVNNFTSVKVYKNVQKQGSFKIIQPELVKFSGNHMVEK